MYKGRQEVDYWEAIRDLGFMDVLEDVKSTMRSDGDLEMLPIQEGNNNKKSTSTRKQKRNRPTQSSRRSNRSITQQ